MREPRNQREEAALNSSGLSKTCTQILSFTLSSSQRETETKLGFDIL